MEDQKTKQATSATTLQDLMNFSPDETNEVAMEPDEDVQNLDFSADKNTMNAPTKVNHLETKEMVAAPSTTEDKS